LHQFFPTLISVVPSNNVLDATDIEEEEQQEIYDNPADATKLENLQPSSQPANSIEDVQEASIRDVDVFDLRTR
jgi:hypothetical protein